jgi:hypothetical protein
MMLFYIFRFDHWHVSPLLERPYARDIINYLNSQPADHRRRIIEIGCGLGDILRNVRFHEKLGLDCDINALRAATFLSCLRLKREDIRFEYSKFPDTQVNGFYDAILMVNWIHNIPPVLLKEKIEEYFREHLLPGGQFLIDTVGAKNYKYNHSVEFLTEGLDCSVATLGNYENMRNIFILKKLANKDLAENI